MSTKLTPLLCVWLALAAGCAKTVGDAADPNTSTETGNPPTIDPSLVALLLSADKGEATVIGEPGAVAPGGSTVEVEVLVTGRRFSAVSAEDGSFEVAIDADLDDLFLVRVVPADGGPLSAPVFVYLGDALVAGADASCMERDAVIDSVLDGVLEQADRSCREASDCQRAPRFDGCWNRHLMCVPPPVSAVGAEQVQEALDALQLTACDGYQDRGCYVGKPAVQCPAEPEVRCEAGRCVSADATGTSCEARDTEIETVLDAALEEVDRSCVVDDDCQYAPDLSGCKEWACEPPVVSAAGAEELRSALDGLAQGACDDEYRELGCWGLKPKSECSNPPRPPACMDGRCGYPEGTLSDEPCAPQLAQYEVGCEPAPRYFWMGSYCQGMTGCECRGPDCEAGFFAVEDCERAYRACEARDLTACGGFAGQTCDDDEYCAYVPNQLCGAGDASAICLARPDACDDNYDPVCGCDGQTYGNACNAAEAGTGILTLGECR